MNPRHSLYPPLAAVSRPPQPWLGAPPPVKVLAPIDRCLLLAALLHLWLVLSLGSSPAGTAPPGQGVWGAINVTLGGTATGRVPDAPAPRPALPTGPGGEAAEDRWGGAVREQRSAEPERPGAARLGAWAPQARPPQEPAATMPTAPAPPELAPAVAPAPPPLPGRVLEDRPAVPATVSAPAAPLALPAPAAPLAPPATAAAVAPAPAEPVAEPPAVERRLDSALARLPSVAQAVAPLALPSRGAIPVPAALPAPLPAPPPAPPPAPGALPVDRPPPVAEAAPVPALRRLGATLPAATVGAVPALARTAALPPLSLPPGLPPLPALPPMPTPSGLPAAGPPPAAARAPDAGTQTGHDVATLPSTPASAPRLNLDLPRLRGGELSRWSTLGALPVLPRPPELPDKLGQEIGKAAREDCRKAYDRLGVLAVVPLAADAVRKDGCKW